MNNWIPVEIRTPPPGERVLVCYNDFVGEAYLMQAGYWKRYDGTPMFYQPTHWMKFPKPPVSIINNHN